jgi:hypothetical protein
LYLHLKWHRVNGGVTTCHWGGAKVGHRIGDSEHYPSSRKVVEATDWYSEFKLRRASDKTTSEAMRKSFNRARDWLQSNDYVREYEDKIWFIDDPD